MNETINSVVVPIALLVLSTGVGAMAWFLKGLREELTTLTVRVASEHERFASREEYNRLAAELDSLKTELHTRYVREDDFVRLSLETRIAIDSMQKQMAEVSMAMRLASGAIDAIRETLRGSNVRTG